MKMSKFIIVLFSIIVIDFNNVYAKEKQLTDYIYVEGVRLLDGYSYATYADEYEYSLPEPYITGTTVKFEKIQDVILKPNGMQLYNSGDYSVPFRFINSYMPIFIFPQKLSGKEFVVYDIVQPYNTNPPTLRNSNAGYLMNSNGKITAEAHEIRINANSEMIDNFFEKETYPTMNWKTQEFDSDRVNKTYTFKSKQINGVNYFALFKELNNDETESDYLPTEKPTEKYKEYIEFMYRKQLLFNNEMCFFKNGITKIDFGIILGRAYCNATGFDIDIYTFDNKYQDINNPYCILLANMDVLKSDNDLFVNEKELSKKTVSDALDKAAEKCGVLTEWNNIKVIQPTDAVCSRELAYVETFRLYELIKKHNNPNYSAFTPSQVLDSDSEAETMYYETVAYNASNVETSTEMTTQATAVNGGNTSKITVASIISSVVAVFAGIIAAAKG